MKKTILIAAFASTSMMSVAYAKGLDRAVKDLEKCRTGSLPDNSAVLAKCMEALPQVVSKFKEVQESEKENSVIINENIKAKKVYADYSRHISADKNVKIFEKTTAPGDPDGRRLVSKSPSSKVIKARTDLRAAINNSGSAPQIYSELKRVSGVDLFGNRAQTKDISYADIQKLDPAKNKGLFKAMGCHWLKDSPQCNALEELVAESRNHTIEARELVSDKAKQAHRETVNIRKANGSNIAGVTYVVGYAENIANGRDEAKHGKQHGKLINKMIQMGLLGKLIFHEKKALIDKYNFTEDNLQTAIDALDKSIFADYLKQKMAEQKEELDKNTAEVARHAQQNSELLQKLLLQSCSPSGFNKTNLCSTGSLNLYKSKSRSGIGFEYKEEGVEPPKKLPVTGAGK